MRILSCKKRILWIQFERACQVTVTGFLSFFQKNLLMKIVSFLERTPPERTRLLSDGCSHVIYFVCFCSLSIFSLYVHSFSFLRCVCSIISAFSSRSHRRLQVSDRDASRPLRSQKSIKDLKWEPWALGVPSFYWVTCLCFRGDMTITGCFSSRLALTDNDQENRHGCFHAYSWHHLTSLVMSDDSSMMRSALVTIALPILGFFF